MFELGPERITKQLLLNCNSEEAYFSHYLGVNPTGGLFRSPLRDDKNPTCSFYRNKNGELIFKDFGTGYHGNFISVVMTIFKVPYYEALSIIGNDFGIISKAKYQVNQAKIEFDNSVIEQKVETVIQCQVKEYSEDELKWWLRFGITKQTLKLFKVYSVDHVFLNGDVVSSSTTHNPIYGYYFGKDVGRELWKIYYPFRKKFRFMLNNSKLQGAKQLPATGDYVVVTKSMKDVMTLHELGIPAVAPQAESVIITSRQYTALKKRFKYVIFNYDWDRTGITSMIQSRKIYRSICLCFTDKKTYAKDISDYVEKVGLEEARKLVNQTVSELLIGEYDYQFNYYDYANGANRTSS